VDVTLYSLKKWAGLACKGNPTALHFLFSKGVLENRIWKEIVAKRAVFLARSHAAAFRGFADAQLQRMAGKRGRGKKGQRPELEQKYGYDVKAGMHVLRLLYECKELLSEGTISLPRPERDFLIRVRTGKYSLDKILAVAEKLFSECEGAAESSSLPEKVDRAAVSKLLADSYRKAWETC
jgi:predicted nucleotidyltransferase